MSLAEFPPQVPAPPRTHQVVGNNQIQHGHQTQTR